MFQGVYGQFRTFIKAYGLWALGLALPIYILYAAHFLFPPDGLVPTGFMYWDMPYYMANAREHFDHGFSLTYGLPFSPFEDTPRIYVQPMTLLLGTLQYVTDMDPGYLFAAFGFLMAILCCGLTAAFYDRLIGLDDLTKMFGLILLMWGGGLFTVYNLGMGLDESAPIFRQLHRFDPAGGSWSLNLGRNLAYSTEALYHALALASLMSVLTKRYGLALVTLGLLSASHPFSGLQINSIFFVWSVLSVILLPSHAPPRFFTFGVSGILTAHILYYLVFLPMSPEHRDIMDMWALPWVLRGKSMLLAYSPVLLGACVTIYFHLRGKWTEYQPAILLLLLVWVVVSVLLAKHELVISPHQPLHFTRGYIWLPLALLSLPALIKGLKALHGKNFGVGLAAGLIIGIVMLADNTVWFSKQVISGYGYVTKEFKEILTVLNEPNVSVDRVVGAEYFAGVYTPHRTWKGRAYIVPNFYRRFWEVAAFRKLGRIPKAWQSETIAFALRSGQKDDFIKRWPNQYVSFYEGEEWSILSSEIDTLCQSNMLYLFPQLPPDKTFDLTNKEYSEVAYGWRQHANGFEMLTNEAGLSFQLMSPFIGGLLELDIDWSGVESGVSSDLQVLVNDVLLGLISFKETSANKGGEKFRFVLENRHIMSEEIDSCNPGEGTVELTFKRVDHPSPFIDLSPKRFEGRIRSLRLVAP